MRSELEQAMDRAYAAVDWWLEGLWVGLPGRLREALFVERTELTVSFADDSTTVGMRDSEPISVDADTAEARTAVAQLVADARVPDVTVLLPPDVVLTHRLRLPAAAESDLRSALAHELDRLTPFTIGDIVFDYRVSERTDITLLIEVALAQRTALDNALQKLERLGLRPTRVTALDARCSPLPLNLLRHRRRLRLPASHLSVRRPLVVAAALLLVTALYLPLARYEQVRSAHEAAVAAARSEAVLTRAQLVTHEAALASDALLVERQNRYVSRLALLSELTAQVPEHTWLSRITVNGGDVHLQGESAAATELLQLLEATELLRDVQFQASVSRDGDSGKEAFTIAARLAQRTP